MPENALVELRGLVGQMGWHHLDGAQPRPVRKQDGSVAAYLGAVEARDFKYRVLTTGPTAGPKPGGGR
jgi:hypothetical protein